MVGVAFSPLSFLSVSFLCCCAVNDCGLEMSVISVSGGPAAVWSSRVSAAARCTAAAREAPPPPPPPPPPP